MENKTAENILIEAIEMVKPEELKELIKKAFIQFIEEQISTLERTKHA